MSTPQEELLHTPEDATRLVTSARKHHGTQTHTHTHPHTYANKACKITHFRFFLNVLLPENTWRTHTHTHTHTHVFFFK